MKATLKAYDQDGKITHQDTRDYTDLSLVWEHVGAQQHNHKTVRVHVTTDNGITYEVKFSPWTPERRYRPSSRFALLLEQWAGECSLTQ